MRIDKMVEEAIAPSIVEVMTVGEMLEYLEEEEQDKHILLSCTGATPRPIRVLQRVL